MGVTGEEWVVEAKMARRAGRLADAAALYTRAAEAYRETGDVARWAHALRHAAELALESGDADGGVRDARAVVAWYQDHPPVRLEMANALRVRALGEAAVGERAAAAGCWAEAEALYAAEGVEPGVTEARSRQEMLRVQM